jgi:transposase-like protein
MKREYRATDELGKQRSIGKFREMADEGASVQLVLPLAEVMQMVQDGCGQLLREAGLRLMMLVMEEEAERLVGPRHQQDEQRSGYRWGNEAGYCVVDGQKVPIDRIRLRSKDGHELALGSYQLFQRSTPLEDGVWWKMMRGLSTRNYGAVTKTFRQAYGIEKSAVSERFVQASKEKLRELLERSLADLDLCAMLIDGTPVKGRQMVAVIGIDREGMKHVLGLREGATENATVVRELLEDLARRGVDFTRVRLYVLDGAKALHTAVKKVAGASALIQRCQLHKKRNVRDHLPKQHQASVWRQMSAAYAMRDYEDARRALELLLRELMQLNPSAARSLEEGLEETLTIHHLGLPELLRRSLATTNIIESVFSGVEDHCRRVKRWRAGDHLQRWVASALFKVESRFRRLKGHKEMPALLSALNAYASQNGLVQQTKAA